jgi:hypothetical protein
MKHFALIAALTFLPAIPAVAQPANQTERVIVTAPRVHSGLTPNAIAHDFVKSFAAPTVLRDAIARWQTAICPDFEGIAPQYAAVMDARFRAIARLAGAPLKDAGCRPNLVVVFTSQPQTYLDTLHKKNVGVLGCNGTTTVSHPVQAWYVTGTQDIRGQVFPDEEAFFSLNLLPSGGSIDPLSTAPLANVGGWRFRPDLSSDLLYVTIIVDSKKTGTFLVGEVADYVAMMALSRTEDYDDCQLVPSITNLLSDNCAEGLKPAAITPTDIAFLRGVYKMDPGANLQVQQDQIAGEMAAALAGGK